MNNENINNTIVISYDDATRMVDFCKDPQGGISKDFYDWYLKEKGEYFSKSGMLIIDYGDKKKMAISFDFTDPDLAIFCIYNYKNQKIVSAFTFNRQNNLTMDNVVVDIKSYFASVLKEQGFFFVPQGIEGKDLMMGRIKNIQAKSKKLTGRNIKKKVLIDSALNEVYKDINLSTCKQIVYFTYALMYYISKKEYEEVTGKFKEDLQQNDESETYKYIYKYNGYIDLMESKIYRPIIKKDADDPVRDYQRHIQKWTVRGHYRKTKNGLIWIEPHEKGSGELEKRIYSTEKENDLPLIPKIFEVEKTRKGSGLNIKDNQICQPDLQCSEKEIEMDDNDFFKKDFVDYKQNKECEKYARELKGHFQLTDFEALRIAIESQRNEFLYRAFMLSNDDRKNPTAIEGIAIALGMKRP
jgi:hypothetical protein